MRTLVSAFSFTPTLRNIRHGHMVKLPGNKWAIKSNKKPKKKWIPVKGTVGFKLDTIEPPPNLLHSKVDPKITEYSYQLDAFPRTKSCDALRHLCVLTKTAEPISLSDLGHSPDSELLTEFLEYIEECCESFNQLFHQKEIKLSKRPTPLELDKYSKFYATGFLQNILNFIRSYPGSGDLLANSHLSSDLRTGTFWRHNILDNKIAKVGCFSFQLENFVDILLRSDKPLSYEALRTDTNPGIQPDWSNMDMPLSHLCTRRLQLFKEVRDVIHFPGFIKETLYPYNHTVFKVVSSTLSDRDLQSTVMVTGYGQTLATLQHRLDFPCRIDLVPEVEKSEAVNVVVTDGTRYCMGVYQLNTSNTCRTQPHSGHVNCCALSHVQEIVREGHLNKHLISELLGLLTAQRHELDELHVLRSEVVSNADKVVSQDEEAIQLT